MDGAPLIAIHKARYFKKKDGLALGPGPFVTGLEYATDTKATVVGKPEQTFFLEALRGIDCAPEEAVMIGDVRGDQIPCHLPFHMMLVSPVCRCLPNATNRSFSKRWD